VLCVKSAGGVFESNECWIILLADCENQLSNVQEGMTDMASAQSMKTRRWEPTGYCRIVNRCASVSVMPIDFQQPMRSCKCAPPSRNFLP